MKLRTLGFYAFAIISPAAAAGPADYLFLPSITYGEREIDFKSGTWKQSGTGLSAASVGFGFGVTQNWFTEIYRKYEQPQGEGTRFDAWEWENKFTLTEPGQYAIDTGFIVELERPQDRAEGYEVRFGPLFQTEFGKVQLNGNILFQRNYRADTPQDMQLGYQWQIKYRWQQKLEFGLQGFGELGKWNDWSPFDQQSHRLGPAIFGKIPLGGRTALRYNAAYLAGVSQDAPRNNLRMQVEYEF
jgi:hypothetical protein